MTLAPSKRLDEYVHDIVVVLLLPFILAFLPGIAVYLFLLENVSRHLPLSLKAAYDLKMFLWVFLTDAFLLFCITGRISLYVWNKEIQLDMCPPPLHVMRKWGLVFCWTENLTDMPAALVRWSRRKLRRLRVRLLWIMRRVRNRCRVGVRSNVQEQASVSVHIPTPVPIQDPVEVAVAPVIPIPIASPKSATAIQMNTVVKETPKKVQQPGRKTKKVLTTTSATVTSHQQLLESLTAQMIATNRQFTALLDAVLLQALH